MFETLTSALHSLSSHIFKTPRISEKDFESMLEKMRDTLLGADIPQSLVSSILVSIKTKLVGQRLTQNAKAAEHISHALFQEVQELLGSQDKAFTCTIPSTIMMVGLQGSGKTTSLAKLAHRLRRENPRIRIVASSLDFYRPAARDQLQQLSQRIGIDYYATTSQLPVDAAREILNYKTNHKYDVLCVDTAGRMNTNSALLDELRTIAGIINPTYTFLVLDAMTGQASLQVAQEFHRTVALSGSILTKIDSGARAGVALAFRKTIEKPIVFMGTGEGMDDFDPFIPQRILQRLFGEGDIASLAEKAEARISLENRKKAEDAFTKDRMNLDDFSHYLGAMASFGSLSSLSRYLPAGLGFKISDKQAQQKERDMATFSAIIRSMTTKERLNHKILNTPRKRRIARGSGVTPSKVDELLITFEEMQGYVKLIKSMEKGSFYPSTMKRK